MGDQEVSKSDTSLLRRLMIGVFGVALFFVALVFLCPYVVPQSVERSTLEKALSRMIGSAVEINGATSFTLLPSLNIMAENLVIRAVGSVDSERPVLADIDQLDLELGTFALLADEIQINKLHIVAPQLRLVRDQNGTGNWQSSATGDSFDSKPDLAWGWWRDMRIGDVQVTNGRFLIADASRDQKIVGEDMNFRAFISNATGAGKGVSVKGSARVNGEPVEVVIDVGAVEKLLAGSRLPLVARVTSAFGQVAYNGAIAKRQYLVSDGRFSVEAPDIVRLEKWLGRIFDVPVPGALAISGRINENGSRFALEDLDFSAGTNHVSGKVLVTRVARGQRIDARLVSSGLELAPFLSFGKLNRWSGSLQGSLRMNWSNASYGSVTSGPGHVAIHLKSNPQRIDITIPSVELFGGQGSAEVQLASGEGMTSFKGQMQLHRVNSELLFRNFRDNAMISGSGDLSLKLFSVGSNFDELLAALRGTGEFNVLAGQVHDEVLADYLLIGSPGSLGFTQMIGSFSVNRGIIEGSDLLLKAPQLSLVGDGVIDLAQGRVDIRLQSLTTGKDKNGDASKTVRPFRINGTLGAMEIRPEEG